MTSYVLPAQFVTTQLALIRAPDSAEAGRQIVLASMPPSLALPGASRTAPHAGSGLRLAPP